MIKYKGQQISHAITKTQYLDIIDDLRKRKKLKILSCVLFMGTKGLRISDTLNLKIVDVFHKNGTLRSNLRFKNQKQKKSNHPLSHVLAELRRNWARVEKILRGN